MRFFLIVCVLVHGTCCGPCSPSGTQTSQWSNSHSEQLDVDSCSIAEPPLFLTFPNALPDQLLSDTSHLQGTDIVIGIGRWAESNTRYVSGLFQYFLPGRNIKILPNPASADIIIGAIWTPIGYLASHRSALRVLISGEYTCPDSITADDYDVVISTRHTPTPNLKSAVHVFLPYFYTHFAERFRYTPLDLLVSSQFNSTATRLSKKKFCAFLYYSEVGFRNDFYDALSSYKHVDALGRARGQHVIGDRFLPQAFDNAVEV